MSENKCTCPDSCDFPEWWGRLTDEDMDVLDSVLSDPTATMDA